MSDHTKFILLMLGLFLVVSGAIIIGPMTAPNCPAGSVATWGHYNWYCVVPPVR